MVLARHLGVSGHSLIRARDCKITPPVPASNGRAKTAAPMLNKFERIRLVRYLGLNTEDSVLVESEADLERHAVFLANCERYSVRTFRPGLDTPYEPHFPIVSADEFELDCLPLLDRGYSLIVANGIDPVEALVAGCIWTRARDYLIEAAIGPGTVRRVTHLGEIDLSVRVSGSMHMAAPPEIRGALSMLEETEHTWATDVDLKDVLYEFSVYRSPVGWAQDQVIFWEIRGLDRQDSVLERFYRKAVET